MSYESYDPYEPYENGDQGQAPRYPEQNYSGQGYPEPYGDPGQGYGELQYGEPQNQQPYEQGGYPEQPYPEQPYPEQPYPEQPYPEQEPGYLPQQARQPQYQDAQWAQSGLGWERQAWDEARLGVSPLQEPGYREQRGEYGAYEQYDELQGYEQPGYEQPGYEQPGYEQPGYEQPYGRFEEPAPGLPRQRADEGRAAGPGPEAEPGFEPKRPEVSAARESAAPAAGPAAAPSGDAAALGRGAFGAAGIAVVAAVAALASAGALAVVAALVQAGVAYGWQHATTQRDDGRADRRTVVLTALIGWAATVGAFRLSAGDDFMGLPATLGVGFLLLAADQTLRRGALGGGQRVTGLAVAVTGGLFAVLPAGFVAAERLDADLTAACALAAAVGVLCCALLGRNPVRGIFVGLLLGAGVGAMTAQSLQATGGLKAGALGGAVAALAAAAAVGATDRVAAEGDARGSTRIVTQVLPVALAAMGALFAAAVYR